MITRLFIQNYAIIDKLELEFEEGFSVFTGETGAGKSILVGAINLLLGEKGDSSIVRSGEEKAIIEGEFLIKDRDIKEKIKSYSVDVESSLIIRREISIHQGKNRVFINGFQEPISKLEEIGQWLIDIHGQHDHQLLLQQKVHQDILDSYGNLHGDIKIVENLYKRLMESLNLLKELEQDQNRLEADRAFMELAVKEIQDANFYEEEEEELTESLKKMENAQNISLSLSNARDLIYNNEKSATISLSRAITSISSIESFDQKYTELRQILDDALTKVEESGRLLSDYLKELDFDEDTLEKTIERLELIKDLKRKYKKNTIAELIQYAEECKRKLSFLDNKSGEIQKLTEEIENLKKELTSKSIDLSRKRQLVSTELAKKIKEELKFLGMEKADFIVDIKYVKDESSPIILNGIPVRVNETGIDRVEFLISTNPGEEPKPLKKVASGGEISRVMLALKSIFAKSDPVETLIFDEIDVGIGGITANNVGFKMKEISKEKQLFVITHLPQIASKADFHYFISKSVEGNKTFAKARLLTKEERAGEIARMLGGETEIALKHAKEMLSN
jgi:DNA repair protein RecN (Recombination protein N)